MPPVASNPPPKPAATTAAASVHVTAPASVATVPGPANPAPRDSRGQANPAPMGMPRWSQSAPASDSPNSPNAGASAREGLLKAVVSHLRQPTETVGRPLTPSCESERTSARATTSAEPGLAVVAAPDCPVLQRCGFGRPETDNRATLGHCRVRPPDTWRGSATGCEPHPAARLTTGTSSRPCPCALEWDVHHRGRQLAACTMDTTERLSHWCSAERHYPLPAE